MMLNSKKQYSIEYVLTFSARCIFIFDLLELVVSGDAHITKSSKLNI